MPLFTESHLIAQPLRYDEKIGQGHVSFHVPEKHSVIFS